MRLGERGERSVTGCLDARCRRGEERRAAGLKAGRTGSACSSGCGGMCHCASSAFVRVQNRHCTTPPATVKHAERRCRGLRPVGERRFGLRERRFNLRPAFVGPLGRTILVVVGARGHHPDSLAAAGKYKALSGAQSLDELTGMLFQRRELLSAITMRVRLRARRAVRSTAPECPALPSPRRAVATRLQPSPNRAGRPCAALCFRYPPSPACDPQML